MGQRGYRSGFGDDRFDFSHSLQHWGTCDPTAGYSAGEDDAADE